MSGSAEKPTFHRFGGDYLSSEEWGDALRVDARVAAALGPEPLEDARHLLAPVPLPPPPPPAAPGPRPGTEYVVELRRTDAAVPLPSSEARAVLLAPAARAALEFPHVWAEAPGANGALRWVPLEEVPESARVSRLALAWPLADLLSEGEEAARDLRRFAVEAGRLLAPAGFAAAPREDASEAARRAARLLDLKGRFGRSVEMRLVPLGRPFPGRAVWRTLYSLGLTWGDLDLFHWHNPAGSGRRLFTVSALGPPAYFLPERAAEGEAVGGLALGFELPYSPAPLAAYDRVAVALAHLRQKLGGRPVTRDGVELDADRLYDERDALEEAVSALEAAGVAPGSPEAARFF